MSSPGLALGVDVGALYLKAVMLDGPEAVARVYVAHQGRPAATLREVLPRFLNGAPVRVGLTGALAGAIAAELSIEPIDLVRALIAAVGREAPAARNIIDVGGGSVTLIRLNERGEFEGITQNSLCAAGTGSFLDEQAARLGVDYAELASFPTVADPPHVATRCAVFAKSDLIHHQQAGRSRVECWSGLCRGMVQTFLATLLKGRPLVGGAALVGGVAQNPEILRRLRELYGDQIIAFGEAHLAGALGAALLAEAELEPGFAGRVRGQQERAEKRALATRPALALHRSRYPSWEVERNYRDELDNEVRVTRLAGGGRVPCYLGLDIGSTSSKLLLTDLDGEALVDVYRRTAGDPIGATTRLFRALTGLAQARGLEFEVRGAGATGSGRSMVGLVIGADAVVNEITCHLTGAMRVDPTIDTIFEIGGQDSKYMRAKNGRIADAAMNYVCAAGTGSFVEEVGRKLGFEVDEIGAAVMGIAPPHTSDRCTVFMDQDARRLLRAGYTREETLAAVLYSVVQNYLNKVVGRRAYSREKIFFQGATARNPGLVAAFENLLGVEMVVSPYAHVMGAWGAALIARELVETQGRPSRFRGLELADRGIALEAERCDQCVNSCELTVAAIEGVAERPSWGYLCGREPDGKKRKVREYRLFEERERLLATVGEVNLPGDAPRAIMPKALTAYSFLPMWRRFFGELGVKLATTGATTPAIKRLGTEIAGGDFCFPIKAALGHARHAVGRKDAAWVFMPHAVSEVPNPHTTNALFCPYVQSYPSLARTALELHGEDASRLLSPVLDLRWKDKKMTAELFETVGRPLGKTKKQVARAWERARESHREFAAARLAAGRAALAQLEAEAKPAILILGRPYNVFDPGVNLGLARKIAERGHVVIPLDFLDFDPAGLGPEFANLYWNYPQRIVHALKQLRGHDRVFPVYFTNFNCGPDSFVETYADHLAGDKPMLTLGLDEHDADAGYITRIEAFLDVVKNAAPVRSFPVLHVPKTSDDEFKRRTIWIPNMHAIGAALGAAAMRGFGYDAHVLPLETDESFEIGRALTSGAECLPTVATIGALVAKLRELDANPADHAFFMATAAGPCRFGQYALKHRLILNRLGYHDLPIMSPSATNSYQGLTEKLRRRLWTLFVASDILFKLRCRVKPYELHPGETDRVLAEELERLERVVERNRDFTPEWQAALARLGGLEQGGEPKPLVGVVGEIYVRCNGFANDRVIEAIEAHGGEAWLAPLSEWFLYTTYLQRWRAKEDLLGVVHRGQSLVKNRYVQGVEHDLYRKAGRWMEGLVEPPIEAVVEAGKRYLPMNFEGEAILTVGRAIKFIEAGAALVVNCAPFGCMPGAISAALMQDLQNRTGVPVVSMFYDGEGDLNGILGVYLAQLRDAAKAGSKGRRHGQNQNQKAGSDQAARQGQEAPI